jgi:hypothetical protein
MSDSGNIAVKEGKHIIYLYTHWGGSDLPETLKDALERGRKRWNDPAYLTRIIFCEMIMEASRLTDTDGLGISCNIQDNEHDLLVVVLYEQIVIVYRYTDETEKARYTFQEFIDTVNDGTLRWR